MNRNYFFLLLAIIIASSTFLLTRKSISPELRMLEKAESFLWSEQSEDGAWKSKTHGILKSGESLTPFVLFHLTQFPISYEMISQKRIQRAMDFIRKNIDDKIEEKDDEQIVLDYPNYTAAYALQCLVHLGNGSDSLRIRMLTKHLINEQFVEHRGIYPDNIAYGGWGFGELDLVYGESGHVDLSHTRRILQALDEVLDHDHPAFNKAIYFLKAASKHPTDFRKALGSTADNHEVYDGGFFASPKTVSTNKKALKCLYDDPQRCFYGSYASATADGLIGLLASGLDKNAVEVKLARQWLKNYNRWDFVQGIVKSDPMQWHEALKFYHTAVRSEAYYLAGISNQYWDGLVTFLSSEQLSNGSFSNSQGAVNKEDDPILATCFAVIALNNLISAKQGDLSPKNEISDKQLVSVLKID